jgi:hypothetical protein
LFSTERPGKTGSPGISWKIAALLGDITTLNADIPADKWAGPIRIQRYTHMLRGDHLGYLTEILVDTSQPLVEKVMQIA